MKKKLEQIVIIGLGKFGMACAKFLSKYDCDVLAIDENEELVEEVVPYVTRAIQVNATDNKTLKEAGLAGFDTAIIGIGDNIESSLMIALTVKEIGIPKIVAKARDVKHAKLLEMIGVTKIVQPEIDSAMRLVNSLITDYVKEKVELGIDHSEYSLLEISSPKEWINKNFGELELRKKYMINVVCIKRNGKIIFPTASTNLEPEDTLWIMASNKSMEEIGKLFQ